MPLTTAQQKQAFNFFDQEDLPSYDTYWSVAEGTGNRVSFEDWEVDWLDSIMKDDLIENTQREIHLIDAPISITKAQAISLGYSDADYFK